MNKFEIFQKEVKTSILGKHRLPRKKKKAIKKLFKVYSVSLSVSGQAALYVSMQLDMIQEQMKPFYSAIFKEWKQKQQDEKIHSAK